MSIDREIKTDLRNLLSMVSCAPTYGHGNGVFYDFVTQLVGVVTDDELEQYAREVASEPGYGEEDYEEILETLHRWKKQYVK